jgi:hypothetical protein
MSNGGDAKKPKRFLTGILGDFSGRFPVNHVGEGGSEVCEKK